MSDPRVDAFLAAEQQAAALVQELEGLKREIGSYRDARIALQASAVGLDSATSRLADLAGKAGEVLESVRRVGTPEILGAIAKADKTAGERSEALARSVHASQGAVIDAVEKSNQRVITKVSTVLLVTIVTVLLVLLGFAVVVLQLTK